MNIAKILRSKPVGTKLWSPIFGDCTLVSVNKTNDFYPIIVNVPQFNSSRIFTYNGKYNNLKQAECLLFPSKYMKDWNKFSWKEGDVLTNKDNTGFCVFNGWKDDYSQIKTKGLVDNNANYISDEGWDYTSDWHKISVKETTTYMDVLIKCFDKQIKKSCSLKPFDKVLGRNSNDLSWIIDFFSSYKENASYPYLCLNNCYRQCIPYEGNEHLLGTTKAV